MPHNGFGYGVVFFTDLKYQIIMEDKIEFIDDFLMRCEDWMHGEDGKDVTICRKYLSELQKQVKNCSIPDVSDLCCASCGYQMKFDRSEDKWGCTKCGHTSRHYR